VRRQLFLKIDTMKETETFKTWGGKEREEGKVWEGKIGKAEIIRPRKNKTKIGVFDSQRKGQHQKNLWAVLTKRGALKYCCGFDGLG